MVILPKDTTQQASPTSHPNTIPYDTDKTFGEHLLASPSYLLHWATRPIGWGIKWAEKTLPSLLKGKRAPYGIYPLFELGGEVGMAYGTLIYHKKFLQYNHQVRIEALFGSEEFNDFDFEYTIPKFVSPHGQLNLDLSYDNDPKNSFYGGNNSSLDDEHLYAREELSGSLEYKHILSPTTKLRFSGGYKKIDISKNKIISDNPTPLLPVNRRGTTPLLSLESSVRFDFVNETPRTIRGSRYILGLSWNRSLTSNEFRYLRYSIEWHQFIPVGFLPDTRRLGLKAHLRKAVPLADKRIPFYEYPSLGSSYNLRGFSSDRFRDDGSLLFTLEYRYPMWDFVDVVLFVDEGQVFSRYSDIQLQDFHTSYGFGFHLISRNGFAFRTEFAFSRETSRIILNINPNF